MQDRILLVDDESLILKALERLLKRSGYQVLTAESGAEAIKMLLDNPCQVVISDFRMPGMTGGELLKQIDQLYPQTVCMVLSGYTDFNAVIDLLNNGTAFRFLQKPWDDDKLLIEVKAAFDKFHAARSLQIRNQFLISSIEPILEVCPEGVITRANAAAERFFKLSSSEFKGKKLSSIINDLESTILQNLLQGKQDFLVSDFFGQQIEFQAQKIDEKFTLLKFQPLQPLTETMFGTVNLPQVLDQGGLLREFELRLINEQTFAAVSVQICDFHLITDVLGNKEAELLFDDIAATLLEKVGTCGRLAYLANEQFVLLFDRYDTESNLHQLLVDITQAVVQDQIKQHRLFQLNFNVAYVVAPEDGGNGRTLLNNLLFTSRLSSRGSHNFFLRYNASVSAHSKQRFQLSEALYTAVENNELSLVLQPKWDLTTESIVSAEVLLRWQHPVLGAISPAIFIEIAEQDGQIHEIGRWIARKACALLAKWIAEGKRAFPLAINVSALQLNNPQFGQELQTFMRHYELSPSFVELELTESAIMENFTLACDLLHELSTEGFSLAIDDFGTGYSSLAHLSRLPAGILKLDKSLIDDLESSLTTQTMLENIIRMAHDLDKIVVVEGVESAEQLQILKRLGCDQAQGFYLSRPLSESDFEKLVFEVKE